MKLTNEDIVKLTQGDRRMENKIFNYYHPLFTNMYDEHIATATLESTFRLFNLSDATDNYGKIFNTYIHQTAKTFQIDLFRKKATKKAHTALSVEDIKTGDKKMVYDIPDDNIEKTTLPYNIIQAIKLLSPIEKKVIQMKLEGFNQKSIAKELEINLNSVKTYQSRAYKRIRNLIEK